MPPTAPRGAAPPFVCTRCRGRLSVDASGPRDRACLECGQAYRVDAVAIDVVPQIAPPRDWGARAMQSRWLAGVYESLWRPLAFGVSTAFGAPSASAESRWILERLGDVTGPVLDLSCGPGRLTGALLQRARGDDVVVGVDLSRAMLEQARERAPGAHLVRADACALPFADETFGAVTNVAALDLYADAARVVAESARVLRRGGRWIVASFVLPARAKQAARAAGSATAEPSRAHKPTIAEIRTAAERAGLAPFGLRQFRGYVLAWADKG